MSIICYYRNETNDSEAQTDKDNLRNALHVNRF